MNLTLTLEQYEQQYIYLNDPIKNNIMNDANFYRILYSTNLVTFNGICFCLNINYISIEKYYNKYKCIFDINIYEDLIKQIKYIELSILNKLTIPNKKLTLKIYEQFKCGHVKIFHENKNYVSCDLSNKSNYNIIQNNINNYNTSYNIVNRNNLFLLKIAGIWENDNEYGLIYKFIKL